MEIIDAYIRKIKRGYKNTGKDPKFEIASGVFRVTSPNNNESGNAIAIKLNKKIEKDEKSLVIDCVIENGSITRQETEELIHAGSTKVFKL